MKREVDIPRLCEALGIKTRTHGNELWAPCPHPDHKETRPSWSIAVNPTGPGNGLHYCFGCQFSGGALDLVMAALGGVSYSHARQWITDRGLWLEGAVPLHVELEVRRPDRTNLRIPKGLLGGPLDTWVTPVRRYIVSRGVTAEQVMRWRMMYATDGTMAGRVVFPLRDERGTWKSFHARTYSNQDKRYKNAGNIDGFDPGAVFGQEHWPKREERFKNSLVLTEGTLDALACERAGAEFICAIGGSAPHPRQLLKLSPWFRIVCATDGDHAGDALADTIKKQLARSCHVDRAPIPLGKDAAQLSCEELKEVLSAAAS